MVIKLNINTVLGILGGLGVFAPDVAFVAAFLARQHVSWLIYPAKVLGFLAAFFAAAPLAVPKLRAFLALFKMATPIGSVVAPMAVKDSQITGESKYLTGGSAIAAKDLANLTSDMSGHNKEAGFIDLESLVIILSLACFFLATLTWTILAPKIARGGEIAGSSPISLIDGGAPLVGTVPVVQVPMQMAIPTLPETQPIVASTKPVARFSYDSKYGACKGNWCLAPALAVQVVQYVPSTGGTMEGVGFTGGYGVVWHTFIDLGLSLHGGFQKSNDKPFTAQGIALFNVANYVSFGPGFLMLGQSNGPAKFQLTLNFGGSWIPGLTTSN
jgi:hypothetical protein